MDICQVKGDSTDLNDKDKDSDINMNNSTLYQFIVAWGNEIDGRFTNDVEYELLPETSETSKSFPEIKCFRDERTASKGTQ